MKPEVMVAEVDIVRPFGIFVIAPVGRKLVHRPMLSWVQPFTPDVHYVKGQLIHVVSVPNPLAEDGFSLSIRDIHSRDFVDKMNVGDFVDGRIVSERNGRTIIEVAEGFRVDFANEELEACSRRDDGAIILTVKKKCEVFTIWLGILKR